MAKQGLNTIELDVKDENGEIGFVPTSVPLATAIGAARPYYHPRAVAQKLHAAGIYLIGRVVTFEDPILAEKRPGLALHNPNGSVWHTNGGIGWVNEYDKRVWAYNIAIAKEAARAGFDEIQFDYVRFPSDGDVNSIVYPVKKKEPKAWTIARFAHSAATQLHPLGVRVSVDVFGLSATRDLGIGQNPARLAKYVDTVYPWSIRRISTQVSTGSPIPTSIRDDGDRCAHGLRPGAARIEGPARALAPGLLPRQDVHLR